MRFLIVTLLAFFAFASPALASAVTDVTVDNSVPTTAAGGRTVFVVGFKATNGVASAGRITVTFASGTTFTGWAGGTVSVGGTNAGNCSAPSNSVIECGLFSGQSIAAGAAVTMTLNGVTNPGNGANTLTVRTIADADPVTAPFTVTAAGRLTDIALDNTTPSNAAGARTRYVASFKLSTTGGMSAQANSKIDVLFPPSTSYLGWTGGVISVGGTDVGNCAAPSNGTVQCSLFTGRAIAANATVQLALNGIGNTTDVGQQTISVDTTSDPAPLPSAPFTVAPVNQLTGVTVANANPSAAAGARTQYVVNFTTSATGALAQAANSRVSIAFPSGTTFPGWAGGTLTVGGTDVGNCSAPNVLTVECSLFTGRSIGASTPVTMTFNGVNNPSTPGTTTRLGVSTTSDPQSVQSANFTVVPVGALSAVTVANGAPSAAAGARTRYVVGFKLSPTGGLSSAGNSRLDFTFPAGTTFPGWAGGTVSVDATAVGNCSAPNGLTVQCSLFTGRTVAPSADVTVTFAGVTNPSTTGLNKTVAVSTTSDPAAQPSAAFAVSGANQLTGLSVAVASFTPSARTRYVVRFAASVTGGLAQEANSRIDLTFPAGTTFAGWSGGTVHDETTGLDVGSCSAPDGLVVDCSLFSGRLVAAGHVLRVTFENITNPASAGPYQLSASTTSDPAAVTSPNYGQGDTLPPETTLDGEAIEGTTARFHFSSSDPSARFECSLDGAAFSACTSPHTLPDLPAGPHTFAVRAVDASGNPDPVPATRTFTAGSLTPIPTTSPDPTPTATATATAVPTATATPPPPEPTFKEDVVVAPASGTVELCDRPGVKCRKLVAGATIPINTTVDARKGVVVLSSVGADGKVETAKFSDGMFKVSQTATTTDLTLNEPLAPCPKKQGKKASAAAGKKKPKTRKLWGDGKGRFRTKGSYSAATVRGTKWLTQDSCAGTLVQVKAGVVSVRDNVKRKTITLRAGKRYTAKPR